VILIIGLFSYIRFAGYLLLNKQGKEKLISEIQNSSKLPERFYEIYDVMYPNSLEPDSWLHFFTHQANSEESTYCACREAVYAGIYPLYAKTAEIIPIINMAESNFTQKKCFDYYINKRTKENKTDRGNLYSLSDEEIILLLLQIENPNYYNKNRNQEKVQARINEILNILNNNLN
jgi:hypothetical protein